LDYSVESVGREICSDGNHLHHRLFAVRLGIFSQLSSPRQFLARPVAESGSDDMTESRAGLADIRSVNAGAISKSPLAINPQLIPGRSCSITSNDLLMNSYHRASAMNRHLQFQGPSIDCRRYRLRLLDTRKERVNLDILRNLRNIAN